MTQVGEGVAVLMIDDDPAEDPKKTKKEPITLRLSIFFDGTGNNRANIQARQQNSATYQLVRAQSPAKPLPGQAPEHVGTASASYGDDFSNIAQLEAGYKSASGYDYNAAFYIEGVGTRDLDAVTLLYEQEMRVFNEQLDIYEQTVRYATRPIPPPVKPKFKVDSVFGFGTAKGSTGIYPKMNAAFNKISDWYDELLKNKKFDKKKFYIAKIAVDVFGFSRGAATARAFIHFMMAGEKVIYSRENTRTRGIRTRKRVIPTSKLLMRLNTYGMAVARDALQIEFVGLFDTVSSYVSALSSDVASLKLDAITQAKKVYHLAAADEHRVCFSLTDISSAKNQGTGEEYFLPGVHSDIGGGYRESGAETKQDHNSWGAVTEDFKVLDHRSWAMRGLNISRDTSAYVDLQTYAKQLENEGWFYFHKKDPSNHKPEIQIGKEMRFIAGPSGMGGAMYEVDKDIAVYRNHVKNSYRTIAFNLMAEEVEKNGFTLKEKLKEIMKVPSELRHVDADIRSYIAAKGNRSSPEDWLEKRSAQAPGQFNLEKLRNEHLHYSASIARGLWPRIKKGKKIRERYKG